MVTHDRKKRKPRRSDYRLVVGAITAVATMLRVVVDFVRH